MSSLHIRSLTRTIQGSWSWVEAYIWISNYPFVCNTQYLIIVYFFFMDSRTPNIVKFFRCDKCQFVGQNTENFDSIIKLVNIFLSVFKTQNKVHIVLQSTRIANGSPFHDEMWKLLELGPFSILYVHKDLHLSIFFYISFRKKETLKYKHTKIILDKTLKKCLEET